MLNQVKNSLSGVNAALTSFIQWLVVSLISIYQKYLSPVKGFSCAYRIHHNAESCSTYVKQAFMQQDLKTAIALSKRRFQDCSTAAQAINFKRSSQKNSQDLMGRRQALRFFSFFSFGFFIPQARGCSGCPTGQACCNAFLEDDDDD